MTRINLRNLLAATLVAAACFGVGPISWASAQSNGSETVRRLGRDVQRVTQEGSQTSRQRQQNWGSRHGQRDTSSDRSVRNGRRHRGSAAISD